MVLSFQSFTSCFEKQFSIIIIFGKQLEGHEEGINNGSIQVCLFCEFINGSVFNVYFK